MTKFTIIVDRYGAAKYLESAIQSIQVQTLDEIQILSISEKQDPESKQLIAQFANSDPRIEDLDCVEYNRAIKKVKGEFVLFLDGRDLLSEKDVLEKIYEIGKNSSTQIIISPHIELFKMKSELKPLPELPKELTSYIDLKNYILLNEYNRQRYELIFSGKFIKKLKKLNFNRYPPFSEHLFAVQALLNLKHGTISETPVVTHRRGGWVNHEALRTSIAELHKIIKNSGRLRTLKKEFLHYLTDGIIQFLNHSSFKQKELDEIYALYGEYRDFILKELNGQPYTIDPEYPNMDSEHIFLLKAICRWESSKLDYLYYRFKLKAQQKSERMQKQLLEVNQLIEKYASELNFCYQDIKFLNERIDALKEQ